MELLHTNAEYESLLRSLLLGGETIPPTPDNFEPYASSEALLADFETNCEAAEKVAVDFAAGTDIPVMTAMRDLNVRHVGRSLTSFKKTMIILEEALFLTVMIDFVSCACQEGYMLAIYERVSKKPKRPLLDQEMFYDKSKASHLRKLSSGVLNILPTLKTHLNLNQLESMQKLINASVHRLPCHLKSTLTHLQHSLSRIISYRKAELKRLEKDPIYEFEDDDSDSRIHNFTPHHNGFAAYSSSYSTLKRNSFSDTLSSSSLESNKVRERNNSNSSDTTSCASSLNENFGQTKKDTWYTSYSSFKHQKITVDSNTCSSEWTPPKGSDSDESDSSHYSCDSPWKRRRDNISPDTLDSSLTTSDPYSSKKEYNLSEHIQSGPSAVSSSHLKDVPPPKKTINSSIYSHNPKKEMTSSVSRNVLTPKENKTSPPTSQAMTVKPSWNVPLHYEASLVSSKETLKKSVRSPLQRGISKSPKKGILNLDWQDINYSTPVRSGGVQADKKLSWSDSRLEHHSQKPDSMTSKSLSLSLRHEATSKVTPKQNGKKTPYSVPVQSSKAHPCSLFVSKLSTTQVTTSKMNTSTLLSQKKPPKDAFQYMLEMQRKLAKQKKLEDA